LGGGGAGVGRGLAGLFGVAGMVFGELVGDAGQQFGFGRQVSGPLGST
jgi:hypothetical protein